MMNEKAKWMNWKRIITIFASILFILLIMYVVSFYRYIEKSKLVDFSTTEKVIYDHTEITSIDKAYQFQDEVGYHIVFGHDKKDKGWIVFMPLEEKPLKEDLIVVPLDSVQTKEQIEHRWKEECQTCVLTGSSPAMINNKPLWELTYKDQSKRYVIEYISLENGSTYEKMRLFRNYNEKG